MNRPRVMHVDVLSSYQRFQKTKVMATGVTPPMPIIKVTSLGHLGSGIPSADVTLVCGHREFPAHRLVLSGKSLYFHSIFEANREDSERDSVVVPEPVTEEVLEDILEFLYSGEIGDKEDEKDSLRTVLSACRVLKMDELFEYTLHRLAEYLSVNDLDEFVSLIVEYEHTGWASQIAEHIINKFCDLHQRSDFYNLEVNELNKILKHVKLEKESIHDFTNAFVTWFNCSQDKTDDIASLTYVCKFTHLSNVLSPLFMNENDDANKDASFFSVVSMNGENTSERPTCEQTLICPRPDDEQGTPYADRFI